MNIFRKHKIVTATVLSAIIGSSVGLAAINQPVDNQFAQVDKTVVDSKEKVEKIPLVVAPEPVLEAPAPEVVDVPVVNTEQPPTVSDEDMYGVIINSLRDTGFERWLTITDVTVVNMLQHHIHGSDMRYFEDELKVMTNKCVAFIENNKQEYLDKYITMASQKMILDARQTPCWLI